MRPAASSCVRTVSIVIVALALGFGSAYVEAESQPAGYIKIATGSNVLVRSGAERQARPGDAVYENDVLRTGVDGRLGVTLKDDTRISLGPGSEIALSEFTFAPEEGRLGFVMKMLRGVAELITGRIAALRPDSVRIETPVAVIGVRGTHLAIRAEGP